MELGMCLVACDGELEAIVFLKSLPSLKLT